MKSLSGFRPPPFKGCIRLPGDKSIAHRAAILAALSRGITRIRNFPFNEDCLSTLNALKRLGVKINTDRKKREVVVYGSGLAGLRAPRGALFVGESGTSIRLLLGVLAGQRFEAVLRAGASLSKRPMLRVNLPLRLMGASIAARRAGAGSEEYPPLKVKGGSLKGIRYAMPVASAQVKSAILLAGLFAKGRTCVIEPIKTRDHTERLLREFGADITFRGNTACVKGGKQLIAPGRVTIPGDISSASFFMAAASMVPGSRLLIRDVGLNPWRLGAVRVLKRMGADITLIRKAGGKAEPFGDILVRSSCLKGTTVKKSEIPSLIDELPVLMVAASCASGVTVFEGVQELRVKETDRIKSMTQNLRRMGASVKVRKRCGREAIVIEGVSRLRGARVRSFSDHRTAMSMAVAALLAKGEPVVIDNVSCIRKSFPGFLRMFPQGTPFRCKRY